jgi:hypothetical protein
MMDARFWVFEGFRVRVHMATHFWCFGLRKRPYDSINMIKPFGNPQNTKKKKRPQNRQEKVTHTASSGWTFDLNIADTQKISQG